MDKERLTKRYNVANDKVQAACELRDDAVREVIEAHLHVHTVSQDEGADEDDLIEAQRAEHQAIHELMVADGKYYDALEYWVRLDDQLKALPVH
jgi:hypothetical protein